MAKPIRSAPTLKGEDAIRFVKEMIREENNPNPVRLKTIRDAMKAKFNIGLA